MLLLFLFCCPSLTISCNSSQILLCCCVLWWQSWCSYLIMMLFIIDRRVQSYLGVLSIFKLVLQGHRTQIDIFQTNNFSQLNDNLVKSQWFLGFWDKKIWYSKVHIFWEGHKILQNLHQLFDWQYIGQIIDGYFA